MKDYELHTHTPITPFILLIAAAWTAVLYWDWNFLKGRLLQTELLQTGQAYERKNRGIFHKNRKDKELPWDDLKCWWFPIPWKKVKRAGAQGVQLRSPPGLTLQLVPCPCWNWNPSKVDSTPSTLRSPMHSNKWRINEWRLTGVCCPWKLGLKTKQKQRGKLKRLEKLLLTLQTYSLHTPCYGFDPNITGKKNYISPSGSHCLLLSASGRSILVSTKGQSLQLGSPQIVTLPPHTLLKLHLYPLLLSSPASNSIQYYLSTPRHVYFPSHKTKKPNNQPKKPLCLNISFQPLPHFSCFLYGKTSKE